MKIGKEGRKNFQLPYAILSPHPCYRELVYVHVSPATDFTTAEMLSVGEEERRKKPTCKCYDNTYSHTTICIT